MTDGFFVTLREAQNPEAPQARLNK